MEFAGEERISKDRSVLTDPTGSVLTDYSDYAFFPIKHQNLADLYQQLKNMFWTPQEIEIGVEDREQWEHMEKKDPQLKRTIEFTLALFSQLDGIVGENLAESFQRETSHIKETRWFYPTQNFNEVIHSETYALLIEAFIQDRELKRKAFAAIENYGAIKKIADWALEWMKGNIDPGTGVSQKAPLGERILAVACLEGVIFIGAFCLIYWVKRQNLLPGLCKANELIARDETIHMVAASMIYNILVSRGDITPIPNERAIAIMRSAMEVAAEFIRDALQTDLIGFSSVDVIEYNKCACNVVADHFGFESPFPDAKNPFIWMNVIGITNKTNFFESRVSEYAKTTDIDFSFDLGMPF